jgi:hypothetical protein
MYTSYHFSNFTSVQLTRIATHAESELHYWCALVCAVSVSPRTVLLSYHDLDNAATSSNSHDISCDVAALLTIAKNT